MGGKEGTSMNEGWAACRQCGVVCVVCGEGCRSGAVRRRRRRLGWSEKYML